MVGDAVARIQQIAHEAGLYAGRGPTHLERLHDLVIPIVVDLEEESVLGFTPGRPPETPPSREHPAYAALHSGTTREQERLAYAYLAAWLFLDGRGCTVPLPPPTTEAMHALPDAERANWLQALALLVPPDIELLGHPLAETARILLAPKALLEFYLTAR